MWWKVLIAIVTFSLGYRFGLCAQYLQDVRTKFYSPSKTGRKESSIALILRNVKSHFIKYTVILAVIFLIVINMEGLKLVYLYSLGIGIVVSIFQKIKGEPLTDRLLDRIDEALKDNEKTINHYTEDKMKKCSYCGIDNKLTSFRCSNKSCLEIIADDNSRPNLPSIDESSRERERKMWESIVDGKPLVVPSGPIRQMSDFEAWESSIESVDNHIMHKEYRNAIHSICLAMDMLRSALQTLTLKLIGHENIKFETIKNYLVITLKTLYYIYEQKNVEDLAKKTKQEIEYYIRSDINKDDVENYVKKFCSSDIKFCPWE